MSEIERLLSKKLKASAGKFPAVAVTGPRQSGKTTLVRRIFPNKPYVSLEDMDHREHALKDPRGFLSNYPQGAILDEVQRAPALFSYLQGVLDSARKPGLFILTGSQHFLLAENISQSLAGRVAILHLLPFSWEELSPSPQAPHTLEEVLYKGLYPPIYDKKAPPTDWYSSYIQTYIQRDVRLTKNITDLAAFQTFVKMCAARSGQLLNLSSLANDCGVTHVTARSWIGVLESSFVLHLLQPHHRNFNKRLVKMPKLYFYDTGLVCALLGIDSPQSLKIHPMRGPLFETFVVGELIKRRVNLGLPPNLYFWRDKTGHEIDGLIENGEVLTPIEIKSGHTIVPDFFTSLNYWKRISRQPKAPGYVIYAGPSSQKWEGTDVVNWKSLRLIKT